MSRLDESGATPYNCLSDYGAIDVLAKQKKLAPFMNSPFESIVKRNSINRDKNIPYAVNFNDRKIKPQRGLINHTKLNLAAATRRPVAFDKSPFEKQIRGRQNYYDISDVRLDLDKYTELLNAEMALENVKKMKELQQAQMFLPNVLKKITAHEKLIEMGIMPKGSKPLLTPAEKAYLNMVGNLSPEQLFAKFSEISKTQEAIDEVAGDGGEVKVGEEEGEEEEEEEKEDPVDRSPLDEDDVIIMLDEFLEKHNKKTLTKQTATEFVDNLIMNTLIRFGGTEDEARERINMMKEDKYYNDTVAEIAKQQTKSKKIVEIWGSFAKRLKADAFGDSDVEEEEEKKSSKDDDYFYNIAEKMIKADIKELGEVYVVNNNVLKSFDTKNQTDRISVLEKIADSIGADYNVKGLTESLLMRTDSTSFKNLDKYITSGKREILIDPVNSIMYWRKV